MNRRADYLTKWCINCRYCEAKHIVDIDGEKIYLWCQKDGEQITDISGAEKHSFLNAECKLFQFDATEGSRVKYNITNK